ncbi:MULTISPECIES: DUF4876 domain-containing protein [Sphingobacterium]|uniref:DUF4876 domain-containing protein n=1 Tax=Sphingobacterium TaxID=28453 RepID=UPI0025E0C5C5|nr:DUF4876 domain-containing protein [Sphingobacterium sp. UBA6320]
MKLQQYLMLMIIFMGSLSSCQKELLPNNGPVDVTVNITYESEEYQEKLPVDTITVNIYSLKGKKIYSAQTDAEGHIKFPQLAPNTYRIQAVISFKVDLFNQLLDRQEDFDITFSSEIKEIMVGREIDHHWDLSLVSGNFNPNGLVIKQIYYAGSHATLGASFRDQFIEIFNNSDQIQYADSLCIAEAYGANNRNAIYTYQANSKQYDWSKSYGMPTNIKANSDYVYAQTILRLPGQGQDYPIAPGQSIVIAATATNHKAPYEGADGKVIAVQDPSLTVDLSKADFEAYYAPYIGTTRPLASDVDNPNVPNVEVIRRGSGADLIMSQTAQQSWFIFRSDAMGPEANWKGYGLPYADGQVNNSKAYIQVPVDVILDAVELQSSTSTQYPKRFSAQNDAGWIAVDGGARSSNAVIRKTKAVVNGRRVLQDSNNSKDDFVSIKANPKGFAD